MKIDIQIDDEKLFTDLALVVDQEDFLTEVSNLRKAYEINNPLSYEEYRDFCRDIYGSKKRGKLDEQIEDIIKKLNLSHTFVKVIEKSIFCGVITEKDYSPAILAKYKTDSNGYDEYCIILSPQARDKDVIEALWEYRDQTKNYLNHSLKDYNFIPIPNNAIVKGKPSIKDHRQWYLDFYYSKLTIEKIERECIDDCPIEDGHEVGINKPKNCRCFNQSTIRKGIENYKSLLWKSRTV